jgi:hypothetical protein
MPAVTAPAKEFKPMAKPAIAKDSVLCSALKKCQGRSFRRPNGPGMQRYLVKSLWEMQTIPYIASLSGVYAYFLHGFALN